MLDMKFLASLSRRLFLRVLLGVATGIVFGALLWIVDQTLHAGHSSRSLDYWIIRISITTTLTLVLQLFILEIFGRRR